MTSDRILIETPVYYRTLKEELVRVCAYDALLGTYTLQNMMNGSMVKHTGTLDAARLSFSISNLRNRVDFRVIEYLLGLEVNKFHNVPIWLIERLNSDGLAFNLLVKTLITVDNMSPEDIGVKYNETYNMNVILDRELDAICTNVLMANGEPNFHLINILQENGFVTRPLNFKDFGWQIGIIETKIGNVIFG